MKKLKSILSIIIVLSTLCSLFSCGAMFGQTNQDSNGNNNSVKKTTISIYNGSVKTSYTVEYGKEASVAVLSKPGYYLDGYYTMETGGDMYFDMNGNSTQVWQEGLPSVFYAQWKPLSELVYSEEKRIENPKSWSGYDFPGFSFELTQEIKNAIKGNLDKRVRITYSFDLMDRSNNTYTSMQFYLSNSLESGRENFVSTTLATQSSYQHYSNSVTTTARKFLNSGEVCMAFKKTYGYDDYYSVKNLKITFEFID
ncbi:MAG: hypothetical protein J6B29_05300 [Clostridia bacterium]|nr:hypothetical protein [Clostridia bacterium]